MFGFLTKRKDPTRNWIRNGVPSIDIGTWKIMGAGIMDPLENLRDLGVCESIAGGCCLQYLRDGIEILHENAVIIDINVFMEPESRDGFKAYTGKVRILGNAVDPASIQSPAGVKALLGDPMRTVPDAVNVYLIYQRRDGTRAVFGFNQRQRLFLITFDR